MFPFIVILAWIDFLPAHKAKKVIESGGKKGPQQRTDPIDPVVPGERAIDHIRAKRASRIKRSSGIVVTWKQWSAENVFNDAKKEGDIPINSATKKARPIPTGARYVDLCLTTASMMITITSWAVRNISMKSPCEMDAPPPSLVAQLSEPGKRALTTPAAAMPPTN